MVATSASDLVELRSAVEDLLRDDMDLQKFCTDATLKRFLVARKGKVPQAIIMLRKTLEWRRSYRPQDITFKEIRGLAATGRLEVLDGTDLQGRPVLCYRLGRQNLKGLDAEVHLRFMLFNLEAASKLADAKGVGKMTWLMDMDNYDQSQAVPFMMQRKITSILQNHYPERLGIILIMRANSIFQALYFLIKGFLDPVTRQKLIFLNDKDDEKMRQRLLGHISEQDLEAALSCRHPDAPFDVDVYERRMLLLPEQ